MKKTIYFLSASDRLNYGDLLFPIIFYNVIKGINPDVCINNYGLIKSDLTYFGALKTKSYREFYNDINRDGGNIIIGGGEVLFSSWRVLYSFISPLYSKLSSSYKFKAFEDKLNFTKYLLSNGAINYPFSPNKNNFSSKVTLQYNSVGGGFYGINNDKKTLSLVNNMMSSDYNSVRDIRAKKSLIKKGIASQLCPDSALIMSDFFPENILKKEITININTLPKKYIFLQIGKNKGPKDIVEFSSNIIKQAELMNMGIVLCPIGQSPNHEDQDILNRIKSLSSRFSLITPENIYDIMYLISKSSAYIGTSLHGLITAQSYNTPFIPLNKKISKLDAYCSTWAKDVIPGSIEFLEIDQLEKIISNWDHEKMSSLTEQQKKQVYNNFNTIYSNLI